VHAHKGLPRRRRDRPCAPQHTGCRLPQTGGCSVHTQTDAPGRARSARASWRRGSDTQGHSQHRQHKKKRTGEKRTESAWTSVRIPSVGSPPHGPPTSPAPAVGPRRAAFNGDGSGGWGARRQGAHSTTGIPHRLSSCPPLGSRRERRVATPPMASRCGRRGRLRDNSGPRGGGSKRSRRAATGHASLGLRRRNQRTGNLRPQQEAPHRHRGARRTRPCRQEVRKRSGAGGGGQVRGCLECRHRPWRPLEAPARGVGIQVVLPAAAPPPPARDLPTDATSVQETVPPTLTRPPEPSPVQVHADWSSDRRCHPHRRRCSQALTPHPRHAATYPTSSQTCGHIRLGCTGHAVW